MYTTENPGHVWPIVLKGLREHKFMTSTQNPWKYSFPRMTSLYTTFLTSMQNPLYTVNIASFSCWISKENVVYPHHHPVFVKEYWLKIYLCIRAEVISLGHRGRKVGRPVFSVILSDSERSSYPNIKINFWWNIKGKGNYQMSLS